jgi:hypothetical protein
MVPGPTGIPHLHLLVTDGGFRPDGTFVTWPAHDTARLTEAFRRAVLRLFVRLELFDEDQAAGATPPGARITQYTALVVCPSTRPIAAQDAPVRNCAHTASFSAKEGSYCFFAITRSLQ